MLGNLSTDSENLSITMKYSIPGYSCAQELDNMHKEAENSISDFYSPLLSIRVLTKVNRNWSDHVLQMTRDGFWDYMNSARLICFQAITCSNVHQIQFSRNDLYNIQFKILHGDKEFITANVCSSLPTRKKQSPLTILIILNEGGYHKPKIVSSRKQKNIYELNEKKKIDLYLW